MNKKYNAIHQFTIGFAAYDAISNEVRLIQKFLRLQGYKSEIYSESSEKNCEKDRNHFLEYKYNKEDLIIYHHSIGSGITDFLLELSLKKIMIYHNITPAQFFNNIDQKAYDVCKKGREDLRKLKNKFEIILADSLFNGDELSKLGFKDVQVLPLILDINSFSKDFDEKLYNEFNDNKTNILFVGRISPNKKQDDILRVFYHYKKFLNSNSRLFLIGKKGFLKYDKYIEFIINKLKIADVYFIENINSKILNSYYKLAKVFLCMSEHEGFCVPLIEAMNFQVPIIAYNSSAVPETLGDSGIIFNKKNFSFIAELVNAVANDETILNQIIRKQTERLKYFETNKLINKFFYYIDSL